MASTLGKAASMVIAASYTAYAAGLEMRHATPSAPAGKLAGFVVPASTTASTYSAAVLFNPTTFGEFEISLREEPSGARKEQT